VSQKLPYVFSGFQIVPGAGLFQAHLYGQGLVWKFSEQVLIGPVVANGENEVVVLVLKDLGSGFSLVYAAGLYFQHLVALQHTEAVIGDEVLQYIGKFVGAEFPKVGIGPSVVPGQGVVLFLNEG